MRQTTYGILSAAALASLFASCSSDHHKSQPGQPATPNSIATNEPDDPNKATTTAGRDAGLLEKRRILDGPTTREAGPTTGGPATPGPAGPAGAPRFGARLGIRAEKESESYAATAEHTFALVSAARLSTFAADVDTASYSNLRRFLREDKLPPQASIRVEEIVNAQDYRDPEPDGREPFAITTELGPCPWHDQHRLLRIGLKTRSIDASRVPPCNLVFLIDVSGSMRSPNKLPLVTRAMGLLADQLRGQDRVSIVTYASGVKLPLPTATGNDSERIHEVLTNLRAGGSTNGQGGIQRAYEVALANLIPEGVNRVILATDGDFNIGIRDPGELEKFITERKDKGVFLTVLGVGGGNLKDDRLERLADKGNGVYAYLDTLHEARRVLVEQFGASMVTVAKDVKLQLEFDPRKVAAYRQIGYENRQLAARDFRNDDKDAGELGAGHAMTALYEIVPVGIAVPGQPTTEADTAAFQGVDKSGALATLRLRYKPPLGKTAREVTRQVEYSANAGPSRDLQVAGSAAALGMLLRGSAYLNNFGFDDLAALIDDPSLDAKSLSTTVAKARVLHQADGE